MQDRSSGGERAADRAGAPGAEPAPSIPSRVFEPDDSSTAGSAIEESARLLRSVFHAVTTGIVFKGPAGEIIDCNAAAERILGVTRDPASGRLGADPRIGAIRENGSPYPLEDWPIMHALRTGKPVMNAIMGLTRADAPVRWLRLNAVPLALPGAGPHAGVVSLEDVTAERRAWVEVRRAELQLRLAMECAGHAYWERDVATDRFVAGAPWTLLGYADRELDGSGEAWDVLKHPEDRAGAVAAYRAHVEGRTATCRSEYRARARDGSWRWILVSGRAISRGTGGQALRLAGTITDVTESKQLEDRLRQAERLASVGTLAAGIAHEVNNPLAYLTANLAFVDEALQQMEGAPDAPPLPELRTAIADALEGAARVKGIVGSLRQFSTASRADRRVVVDPHRQVEAALTLVRNEIAHRARLRVDLPAELPSLVAADYEISQILVNLLVNAAQAIPEGHATENEVAVAAAVGDGRLVFTVSDTGTGIAAADLPRIFDPFFTTKPFGAGSGLGLSICHGIVSSLGGTIEVDSAVGRGSTFRVVLPLRPTAEAPATAPPAPIAPVASRVRVLLIDDEPLVARSMARLLGPAHDVTALTSPVEALQRARTGESWDVVLCDLMMPEMSGIEFEAELSRERPDLVERVLYVTGGAFTERSRSFLASGRPHLAKPVAANELRIAVAQLAGRGCTAA